MFLVRPAKSRKFDRATRDIIRDRESNRFQVVVTNDGRKRIEVEKKIIKISRNRPEIFDFEKRQILTQFLLLLLLLL
jgi:hypothetical protein